MCIYLACPRQARCLSYGNPTNYRFAKGCCWQIDVGLLPVGAKHSDGYLSGNHGYLFPNADARSSLPLSLTPCLLRGRAKHSDREISVNRQN
jgi:hypothetical protein